MGGGEGVIAIRGVFFKRGFSSFFFVLLLFVLEKRYICE